jgi:hypothetical protein
MSHFTFQLVAVTFRCFCVDRKCSAQRFWCWGEENSIQTFKYIHSIQMKTSTDRSYYRHKSHCFRHNILTKMKMHIPVLYMRHWRHLITFSSKGASFNSFRLELSPKDFSLHKLRSPTSLGVLQHNNSGTVMRGM